MAMDTPPQALTGASLSAHLAWRDTPERAATRTRFFDECILNPTSHSLARWKGHAIWSTWRNEANHLNLLLLACHQPLPPQPILGALLENGVSPHAVDKQGRGALAMTAPGSKAHRRDWFRALLDLGVDPNAVDHQGRSPMSWVLISGDVDLLDMLIEAGGVPTQADRDFTTEVNHAQTLKQFFNEFGPPEKESERTAYCFRAAGRGLWNVVRALLPYGVDLQATQQGHSLITLAAERANLPLDVIEQLVSMGADPDFRHPDTGRDAAESVRFVNRIRPQRQAREVEKVMMALARGRARRLETRLAGTDSTICPRPRM